MSWNIKMIIVHFEIDQKLQERLRKTKIGLEPCHLNINL